jgi:glutathione S-transferase
MASMGVSRKARVPVQVEAPKPRLLLGGCAPGKFGSGAVLGQRGKREKFVTDPADPKRLGPPFAVEKNLDPRVDEDMRMRRRRRGGRRGQGGNDKRGPRMPLGLPPGEADDSASGPLRGPRRSTSLEERCEGSRHMLTIYGVHRSRALRPLWLLAETGTAFVHEPVIQAYRQGAIAPGQMTTESPEFRLINPLGQVPAMKDGSLVLTESLAICLHIARKHAAGGLGPRDGDETALMEQWALFAATAIEPAAIEVLYTFRDGRQATPEGEGILALAAERLKRPLDRLESALRGRDWLLDRFTVADIMVAECLRYAQGHPPVLAPFPQVSRWLAACQDRPAFREVWARREAEPA